MTVVSSSAMLVYDPYVQSQVKAERELSGAARWDEVWEGTYVVHPVPNIQHQELMARLVFSLHEVLNFPSAGSIFPGVNVSDRVEDWGHNHRVPDVAIYLAGNQATDCNTHWCGGPDLAVEIASPGDRSRDKIPFYEKVNTRELYILDRNPWTLEQFGLQDGRLVSQGQSTCESPTVLASRVLPVQLRLISGTPRPRVEVVCPGEGRQWFA